MCDFLAPSTAEGTACQVLDYSCACQPPACQSTGTYQFGQPCQGHLLLSLMGNMVQARSHGCQRPPWYQPLPGESAVLGLYRGTSPLLSTGGEAGVLEDNCQSYLWPVIESMWETLPMISNIFLCVCTYLCAWEHIHMQVKGQLRCHSLHIILLGVFLVSH